MLEICDHLKAFKYQKQNFKIFLQFGCSVLTANVKYEKSIFSCLVC